MRGRVTRFLRAADVTADVLAAWDDLIGRAAEPNPFGDPRVVLPSLRHLDHDRRRAGVLTVWAGDRLDAVLAVARPVQLPLPRGGLPLPAWEALTTPYRPLSTPLLDAGTATDSMDALLRMEGVAGPAVALAFRYFPEDGPVAAALDESLAARGLQAWRVKSYERAVLVKDGGAPMTKNRRRRFRKIRLAREELDRRFGPSRIVDRSSEPKAVETFLRLEASGWKGQAGTALACRPAHAAWFREVCAGLSSEDRLEILALEIPGRTIAMECNFVTGDSAFEFKDAYDEAYADHLPGMQQVMHLVEQLPHSPIAFRDSCTVPDNVLMNQMWGDRRRLSTVLVPLHGRIGAAALRVLRGAAPAVLRASSAVHGRTEGDGS